MVVLKVCFFLISIFFFFSAAQKQGKSKTQTFKEERFIPVGVEVFPLDLCFQLVLLVRQQVDLDKRVGGAREVFGRQVLTLENFDSESRVLETVAYAELDAPELLTDWPFTVVVLRAWG